MEQSKILTIIIPTYNMEKFLRKCLDSLIVSDENMQRLEVLVVNDGSKDASSQIAHEYEAKYPQTFRVIDKENGNYGSCVNRGLKEATGKYVKVLDADDYFDNDIFNQYLLFLKEQEVDLVISDFNIVDENGVVTKSIVYSLPSNKTFTLAELSKREGTWLWHHALAYKRDLFNKFEYKQTEGISYSDEEWVFKPMVAVQNVFYFNKVLYLYLRGREGQTYDPNVLKRTRSQKDIMVNALVCFYDKYREKILDEGAAKFMYDRVMLIMTNMYKYYIFDSPSDEGSKTIVEFDQQLKSNCLYLYKEMDSFRFKPKIPFCYIRMWRKKNYNHHAFSLSFYRFVCKELDIIRNKQ